MDFSRVKTTKSGRCRILRQARSPKIAALVIFDLGKVCLPSSAAPHVTQVELCHSKSSLRSELTHWQRVGCVSRSASRFLSSEQLRTRWSYSIFLFDQFLCESHAVLTNLTDFFFSVSRPSQSEAASGVWESPPETLAVHSSASTWAKRVWARRIRQSVSQ